MPDLGNANSNSSLDKDHQPDRRTFLQGAAAAAALTAMPRWAHAYPDDFAAIRAFPSDLRWFVRDEDDERFLEHAAEHVFDAPSAPAVHRRQFLQACFERLSV